MIVLILFIEQHSLLLISLCYTLADPPRMFAYASSCKLKVCLYRKTQVQIYMTRA